MSALVLGASSKPKADSGVLAATFIPKAEVRVAIDAFASLPPALAYQDLIEEAATRFSVDADLIHAVIETESHFDSKAESAVGAQGLMQLMPIVQEEMGVRDAFDPRDNVMGGTAYLKRLLERHNGDVALALAAYNAGPGTVARYRGIPPFRETRRYVKKIKALLAAADDE
jgi:soluble lytic murein transglycosylase-like protein